MEELLVILQREFPIIKWEIKHEITISYIEGITEFIIISVFVNPISYDIRINKMLESKIKIDITSSWYEITNKNNLIGDVKNILLAIINFCSGVYCDVNKILE